MTNSRSLYTVQSAIIAALYVVLTFISAAFGLASGVIQIRLSEALAILPYFCPAAVPGLTVGCLIANLLTGCAPWDVFFGSLATLIGALGARALRKYQWLVPLPTIISNTVIIPFVLSWVYNIPGSIPYFMLTVGAGEVISCGVLGMIFLFALKPYSEKLFGRSQKGTK